jgi:hypothetical protein
MLRLLVHPHKAHGALDVYIRKQLTSQYTPDNTKTRPPLDHLSTNLANTPHLTMSYTKYGHFLPAVLVLRLQDAIANIENAITTSYLHSLKQELDRLPPSLDRGTVVSAVVRAHYTALLPSHNNHRAVVQHIIAHIRRYVDIILADLLEEVHETLVDLISASDDDTKKAYHETLDWCIGELQDSVMEFHESEDAWMLEESLYATSLDCELGYELGALRKRVREVGEG